MREWIVSIATEIGFLTRSVSRFGIFGSVVRRESERGFSWGPDRLSLKLRPFTGSESLKRTV